MTTELKEFRDGRPLDIDPPGEFTPKPAKRGTRFPADVHSKRKPSVKSIMTRNLGTLSGPLMKAGEGDAGTPEWVIFKFHAPPGAAVYVAGTFNNWDPAAIRLDDTGKGTYTATVLLPLGTYEYKFIVNGEWHNAADDRQQVPNPFGTTNNVLVVKRDPAHKAHLRAFSRMPVSEDRPLYTSPLGG